MVEINLRKKIHESNIKLHQIEAKYYDLIHHEIYNKTEQKRIFSVLKKIDTLIGDNQKRCLDFGAGTGNITGKLLNMGYEVTAIDISKEMCGVLKNKYKNSVKQGKLRIINSKIENANFKKEEFDFIICYSVLHHLPDYINVVHNLSLFLKKGGIMCLDHESSPFSWNETNDYLSHMIKKLVCV